MTRNPLRAGVAVRSGRLLDERGSEASEAILVLVLLVIGVVVGWNILHGHTDASAVQAAKHQPVATASPAPTGGGPDLPWQALGFGAAGLVLLGGTATGGTVAYRATSRRRTAEKEQAAQVAARWAAAVAKHDQIRDEYAAICCDPLAALDYMALWDIRDTFTEKFTVALGTCNDLRSIHGDMHGTAGPRNEQIVAEFAHAVETCGAKWRAARTHAAQRGLGVLSKSGQSAAKQARKLLAVALNEAATDAERNLAAQRAAALLNSLADIDFPEETRAAIAAPTRRQIAAPVPTGQPVLRDTRTAALAL